MHAFILVQRLCVMCVDEGKTHFFGTNPVFLPQYFKNHAYSPVYYSCFSSLVVFVLQFNS